MGFDQTIDYVATTETRLDNLHFLCSSSFNADFPF